VATSLSFDLKFGLVKSCGMDLCPILNDSLNTKHTAKVRHEGFRTMKVERFYAACTDHFGFPWNGKIPRLPFCIVLLES